MLDVHRLRLLRELAYRDTIAAVAQALSYTPSAVSQQLSILEREAGVPLLERTGRRVRLTPAARTLVAHAEQVLAGLTAAEAALAAARQGLTGTLRLGAFPSAARTLLPGALVALGRDHPGLEFAVEEYDPAQAAEALRTGELDAALTHDYDLVPVPEPPALESTVVLTEAMLLASRHRPDDPSDPVGSFREHAWIMGKAGNQCGLAARRICEAAGFQPRIRHQTDDFPTALALVAAGQGQALLPGIGTVNGPRGIVLTPLPATARVAVTHRRGAGGHPAIVAFRAAIGHAVERYLGHRKRAWSAGEGRRGDIALSRSAR
jgi:DNA-binding transcriptional LysR family regulator